MAGWLVPGFCLAQTDACVNDAAMTEVPQPGLAVTKLELAQGSLLPKCVAQVLGRLSLASTSWTCRCASQEHAQRL